MDRYYYFIPEIGQPGRQLGIAYPQTYRISQFEQDPLFGPCYTTRDGYNNIVLRLPI